MAHSATVACRQKETAVCQGIPELLAREGGWGIIKHCSAQASKATLGRGRGVGQAGQAIGACAPAQAGPSPNSLT